MLDWPLMRENITRDDRNALKAFLDLDTRLTNGDEVIAFEREFSDWLGVKYSVMVNSGASANLITMAAIRQTFGPGEVIVPCITWSSDIAAVIHAGLTPVFMDVEPTTLGMSMAAVVSKITKQTRAIFPTHCLGFGALAGVLPMKQIDNIYYQPPLIEDCCEAIGAYVNGVKLGSVGFASNFSFYYAHHMSTIEGGMVCTNDYAFYQVLRRLRSHGLTREMTEALPAQEKTWPEFTFMEPAYNVRPTELNAVLGREQLKRLDVNNRWRSVMLKAWLGALDKEKYWTDYAVYGSSNYALPLILHDKNQMLYWAVCECLATHGVEFRRGTAGGGNQLRQPYARKIFGEDFHKEFPVAEHIHQFGLYIGNYPGLEEEKIHTLCSALNKL